MVEVMLGKYLSIVVFGLEVAANNGGPFGYALDMVGHDPNILEITA
jgi:hypothetical protein